MTSNTAQFTDKYTKGNFATRRLLDGFFKRLRKNVARAQPHSILEVGCGPGYSTQVLRETAPQAILQACDIDDDLLELARRRVPGILFQKEDIHGLSYPDATADLVVCLEVLEHVADPDKALRELARVTKTHAILSVPREPLWRALNMARGAYWKDFGNTPGHINHWSARGFARFAEACFDVVDVATPLPWTMLFLKKRVGSPS